MKGKVNCTCGWSWNKSDSSSKDMYICHECGRDNSNNISKAQEGIKYPNLWAQEQHFQKEKNKNKEYKKFLGNAGEEIVDFTQHFIPGIKNLPSIGSTFAVSEAEAYNQNPSISDELGIIPFYPAQIASAILLEAETEKQNMSDYAKNKYKGKDITKLNSEQDINNKVIDNTYVPKPKIGKLKETKKETKPELKKETKPQQTSYKEKKEINKVEIDKTRTNKPKVNTNYKLKPESKIKYKFTTPNISYRDDSFVMPNEVNDIKIDNTYVAKPKYKGNLKNGGWLDLYADGGTMQEHQENYNDSKATAFPDMVGDGYSNVGRKFSPAWGGQFQNGGNAIPLKEVVVNKKGKTPIYTSSRNDPRYKAYQDSLYAYNMSKNIPGLLTKLALEQNKLIEIDPNDPTSVRLKANPNSGHQEFYRQYNPFVNKKSKAILDALTPFNDYIKKTGKKPTEKIKTKTWVGYQPESNSVEGLVNSEALIFKKPQQPIIIQEQELQNNLQPAGLVQGDTKLNADTSGLHPQARQAKYYNIQENINQPFGGSQTNYRTSDLNSITSPDDLGPGNTRKIVPHYQTGGEIFQAQDGYRMGTYFNEDAREKEPNMMEETYDDYNTGMKGMMKSKMATQAALGNPGARRMMSHMPAKYTFTGNERFSDGRSAEGAGAYGSHYISNTGNYVYPNLQDNGEGTLNFIPNASPSDREAMRFENPGEADYFANHYKEVAPMMKHYNKLAMGGSIPGSVDFSYPRTKGIPSEGPYAKKTLPSAQTGKDIHGNPFIGKEVHDPKETRSHYDPRLNIMHIGTDYDTWANKDKLLAHENYHAIQHSQDRDNFDIAHNTDDAQWAQMQKRPEVMSTNGVWNNFYNRGNIENDQDYSNYINNNPESRMINSDVLFDKVLDNERYYIPDNQEGEAKRYEETGIKSFQNGGEMKFYQEGLDWKPKSISRNGAWLNKYEQAQTGKTFKLKDERLQAVKPSASTFVKKPNFESEQNKVYKTYIDQVGKQNSENKRRQKLTPKQRQREDYTNYNEEHGSIQKHVPESTWDRSKAIASNPLTAFGYAARNQSLPARFQHGERNVLDNAIDWINPLQGIAAASEIPGELGRGEYLNAGLSLLDAADLGVYAKGAMKASKPFLQKGIQQLGKIPISIAPELRQGLRTAGPSFNDLPKNMEPHLSRIGDSQIGTYTPFHEDDYMKWFNEQKSKMNPSVVKQDPRSILRNSSIIDINDMKQGGIIKDDRGQWDHPGEITEIGSNNITMEGVPYDVLGVSDTGDTKLMKPGKNYKFKGKKVTEFPMAKNGMRQEQKGLQNLDNLVNFTNYNKPQPDGWLNKYN